MIFDTRQEFVIEATLVLSTIKHLIFVLVDVFEDPVLSRVIVIESSDNCCRLVRDSNDGGHFVFGESVLSPALVQGSFHFFLFRSDKLRNCRYRHHHER